MQGYSLSFRIDEGKDIMRNLVFDAQIFRKGLDMNVQTTEPVQSTFLKVAG